VENLIIDKTRNLAVILLYIDNYAKVLQFSLQLSTCTLALFSCRHSFMGKYFSLRSLFVLRG